MQVLLLQLPVPNNPATNVPLAAGYLKAYAQAQGLLDRVCIELLPRELADDAGDAHLVHEIVARRPDVLGVSLYTWNSERTMGIVARVRTQLPSLRIVAGGPEVQHDNQWLLGHSALDVAVIGEGEQTFCDLLRYWLGEIPALDLIAGIAFWRGQERVVTSERVALADLSPIPSPYLLGYLDVEPGGMLMVEVSRWCPYSCSFCLYGRNMGPKLGSRYFGLERVLAEIRWGYERGVRAVHFIEANLNLVPLFWPLVHALEDLNAAKRLTFYAELRGEHLTDEVVAALDRCNVRVVEVGLQTANPVALRASLRRTDLAKWAAGTRRLYKHKIDVYLDVILGLPADDAEGVAETLGFIRREALGPYDIFMLQVLPGTAVRRQATMYGLAFQQRPPYYVLATDRLSYQQLRELRRMLKHELGHDPDAVEGAPEPQRNALLRRGSFREQPIEQLAAHTELVATPDELAALHAWLAEAITANPTTVFDLYLLADTPPPIDNLQHWRDTLPYTPGYLDRIAVYRRNNPTPDHARVSPRIWLVLPWTAQADPLDYAGLAEIIWRYELAAGEVPPLGAWRGAGGAGVYLPNANAALAHEWEQESGVWVWALKIED